MSDDLSAILETTTAERLATGVQQQSATRASARPPTPMGMSSRRATRRQEGLGEMSVIPLTVLAFGDESENDELLVYALALFQPKRADEARAVLAEMKRTLRVPVDVRLHCRIVFSGQRRRGTPWADVNHASIQVGVRALVAEIGRLAETPEIGLIDRRRVPLLPTSPGHADREWLGKETLSLTASPLYRVPRLALPCGAGRDADTRESALTRAESAL